MSLKIEFVERAQRGEKIAVLCREFGISRTTGHKWVKRFEQLGYEGLEEQSRRPKATPLCTAEDVVLAILQARDKHPTWGPEKLNTLLKRRLGDQTPSKRTIARVLKRAGKVRERRRRRPLSIVDRAPLVAAEAPNDVWTVDFKGWWRARNGQRCEPLTVRDAHSRMVLACTLCRATTEGVRAVFEKLFKQYGIPRAIQCDNGVPFVSVRSRGGLSSLSAWWVSLGIRLVRSRPACPQDNPGHERMHADIAAEVEVSPAADAQAQQRVIDKWRQEFNHVRPHQALGNKTPAEVYKPTERRSPSPIAYCYPAHFVTRSVCRSGHISFRSGVYFVSESLRGHDVALEIIDVTHVRIWFHDIDLGVLDVEPEGTDTILERWLHPEAPSNQSIERPPPC
jgi:transposase InsO family protein